MTLYIVTLETWAWAFAGGMALFGGIALYALVAVYAERKISAFIQDRLGPMETGPKGAFQTLADILKLLMKENIVPTAADSFLFTLAPVIVFLSVFAGFAVIPWTQDGMIAPINAGLLFITAVISLEVMGIMMAGWGSNNKYSIIGALRAVAQMISYEIPAMLAILSVVILTGTLNLNTISLQQGIYYNPAGWGGFLQWNIIQYPHLILSFIIFFISTLAETNRAPFDIPEAESELVAGFHTEYSGFKFAMFMLAEYAGMLLLSLVMTLLFLGGWNTPFPNLGVVTLAYWTGGEPGTWLGIVSGAFWLLTKSLTLVMIMMWVRWTFPRVRPDQLMRLCWKVLVPIALALIIVSAVWKLIAVYV